MLDQNRRSMNAITIDALLRHSFEQDYSLKNK
jgi:hypothetical protein